MPTGPVYRILTRLRGIMRRKRNSMDEIAINLGNQLAREKPVVIELTVRASDGSFDASLSFPVTATREEINRVVEGWMKMMREAVYMFEPKIRPLAGSQPAPPR